ncbi:hypothetical protein BU24DRAFT_420579, partial [Aaosphaeria arxii CBS 175.79]
MFHSCKSRNLCLIRALHITRVHAALLIEDLLIIITSAKGARHPHDWILLLAASKNSQYQRWAACEALELGACSRSEKHTATIRPQKRGC